MRLCFGGWCAPYFKKRDYCQGRDRKDAVLRRCDSLKPCGFYNQPTQQWNKLSVGSCLTLRRDDRGSLPCRGRAGFVPAGSEATGAATGAPLAPAGRAPPPRAAAGTRGGGLARHGGLRGSRRPAARPGRSRPGSCPPPGRPEATVSALCLWREAGALVPRARPKGRTRLFGVVSWLAREGRCRLSPAGLLRPGSSGGCREVPGAAPPRRQSEGSRAKIACFPHLGALFDLMRCLGRAVTEAALPSEVGGFVRCSPHAFLTSDYSINSRA